MGQQQFNGNSPVDREVAVHLGLLVILGSHRFLGDLNIISLTKGRVSRFLGQRIFLVGNLSFKRIA